jgi:hypothetical protein
MSQLGPNAKYSARADGFRLARNGLWSYHDQIFYRASRGPSEAGELTWQWHDNSALFDDEMMALVSLARSYFRNAFQQNLPLADCPRPKRKAAIGWPTSAVASSASSHNMATANRLFCRQFLD